ncbi:protein IQ-DOMAIN 14-like [Canna indica]|uniref:Protein IQ-DOMAIN 14-like n=1 Tax=Canna indica TaxID=4628 RepID=A0AAQ3KM22_9LILI|nr:protein IQ-DOMAIN 14-like [Canna indica]
MRVYSPSLRSSFALSQRAQKLEGEEGEECVCRAMGKATRWLRSILGGGKKDAKVQNDSENGREAKEKEKKRWSFARPRQPPAESMGSHSPASPLEMAWLRSFYGDGEEGSNHAVAVAVATAAAANAALTAAQAAMVRLKSFHGERTTSCGSYERWAAAVKIQTAFRCHLAKKALRALKALVKLQALVRGFLVRKQASIAHRRLQALIRAQSAARSRQHGEFSRRRSFERLNSRVVRCKDVASEKNYEFDESPKNLESEGFKSKSKSFRKTSSSNLNALEELVSSPVLYKVPPRLSIPSCRNSDDRQNSPCLKTAQSTPRLRPGTPARSFAMSPSSCPNYMASTTSFVAKARAESAPKQRPEKACTPRKKVSGKEEMGGGRSPLRARAVGKLDRSPMAGRESAMYNFFNENW